MILMLGIWMPSWKISVAFVEKLPAFLPPTSTQWALLTTKAMSSPLKNTGGNAEIRKMRPAAFIGIVAQKHIPGMDFSLAAEFLQDVTNERIDHCKKHRRTVAL